MDRSSSAQAVCSTGTSCLNSRASASLGKRPLHPHRGASCGAKSACDAAVPGAAKLRVDTRLGARRELMQKRKEP
jgi:hypothetical protein